MAVEVTTQVKRTIWVAACEHNKLIEVDDPGNRETYCGKCKQWIKYVEESYTGPVLNNWSSSSRR